MTIDERQIRAWWALEKNNEDLVEIRVLGNKNGSGYFKNIENLITELKRLPDGFGVYYTMNRIHHALYDRKQKEKILMDSRLQTTSDKDIIGRDILCLDLDPKRPSGINATEEELGYAKAKANEIYAFLRDNGFNPPIVAISANGVHIKIKIAIKNDDESLKLIKDFLAVMDMLFSDEKVDVDVTLSNASRILKLPGTKSAKGADTEDRPQRFCYYVKYPTEWQVTEREYIQKIANMLPQPEQPDCSNHFQPQTHFNLEDFIKEHNIKIARIIKTKQCTKYILAECPFDSNHKAPDACVFAMADGSYGFHCFHNSCSVMTFKDFRLHYDPKSYDRATYAEYRRKRTYYGTWEKEPFVPAPETEELGKKWLDMTDIQYIDVSQFASIPTGYIELDRKIVGLTIGEVSVLAGSNGCGKTSLMDCIILNAIQRGYKALVFSGELKDWNFQSWLDIVAAGKGYTKKREGYDDWYYCPRVLAEEKINPWLKDKLKLYNNNYGNNFAQLKADIEENCKTFKPHLIIIDNLTALDLSEYEGQSNAQQKKFIQDVKKLARELNVHILIVCHPKKKDGLIRKEDISGSLNLSDLVDNVFLLHRVYEDFSRRLQEYYPVRIVEQYTQYNAVLEVAKNRFLGVVDYLVGMYFEVESKRLKNSIAEHIVYSWNEQPTQRAMLYPSDPMTIPDEFFDSDDEPPF